MKITAEKGSDFVHAYSVNGYEVIRIFSLI